MNQTGTYVNIMRESLLRKKKYLKEVLDLTKKQEQLAKAKKIDEEAFGETIDRKDVLINNILEIDKGFSSVYDRVRSEVLEDKELYQDELISMQSLIKECVDLGMKIEALEERNRASLERAFSTGFKGIRRAKHSKNVANKYYKSMSNGNINDSILYDRKK
ncbi:MAG: hypothetical protein NC393_06035 [Clostridium sp.]|nr:hypothetical protein [Clostridium sp.]MCM1207820.1 hypothetical protein [Ruminococcus sp.]